jgi:hypothetical protein
MVVYLFFYSAKGAVDFAVVGFVFFADFVDESNENSEAPTDKTNHNFSCHITDLRK